EAAGGDVPDTNRDRYRLRERDGLNGCFHIIAGITNRIAAIVFPRCWLDRQRSRRFVPGRESVPDSHHQAPRRESPAAILHSWLARRGLVRKGVRHLCAEHPPG